MAAPLASSSRLLRPSVRLSACLTRPASTSLIESARPRKSQTRAVAPLDQADYDLIELTIPEPPFPAPLSPSFGARKPGQMGQNLTIMLQWLRPFGGVKYLLPITYMPTLYEPCADRASSQHTFWLDELGMAEDFDTWLKITSLHLWLLVVRFRRLPRDKMDSLRAELANVFATDIDLRFKTRHGVKLESDQRKFTREAYATFMATCAEYDEALFKGDWALFEVFVGRLLDGQLERPLHQSLRTRATIDPEVELLAAQGEVKELTKSERRAIREAAMEADRVQLLKDQEAALQVVGIPEARVVLALERLVQYTRQELKRMEDISDETMLSLDPAECGQLVAFQEI